MGTTDLRGVGACARKVVSMADQGHRDVSPPPIDAADPGLRQSGKSRRRSRRDRCALSASVHGCPLHHGEVATRMTSGIDRPAGCAARRCFCERDWRSRHRDPKSWIVRSVLRESLASGQRLDATRSRAGGRLTATHSADQPSRHHKRVAAVCSRSYTVRAAHLSQGWDSCGDLPVREAIGRRLIDADTCCFT